MSLRVRGLCKAYSGRRVLDDVDLDIAPGEFAVILGANGSGKSTALRCVVGLETPDAGEIQIGGAGRAAMVFQKIHLVGRRTALDNVCAGALGRLPLLQSLVFPRAVREQAMACLDRVGLADRAGDRTGRLSGGQQQRVAIARALCRQASVVLADEPVSALDPSAAEQVVALLAELAGDGLAVAAVLHQPDLARRHAHRIVGLLDGRIVFDTATDAVSSGEVERLYAADRLQEPAR
jgi:phosphonate transport system ATP-binding protein